MGLEQVYKRIEAIENLQLEIKNAKEILKGELENEDIYREAIEEANSANSKKKRIKDEILGKGSNQKLVSEVKDNQEELATLRDILSAELMEVYKESDTDEFTDMNGNVRKFTFQVKLLPKGDRGDSRDSYGKYAEDGEVDARG